MTMKSQNLKRIILAVLAIVLFAVWWDNLKLFYGNENKYDDLVQFEGKPVKKITQRNLQLEYKPPRVNPFWRADLIDNENRQLQERIAVAPVIIEKPSSRHKLLGVLKDKKKPQAVLNSNQGTTAVLSVSDSLENWVLITVDTNLIVFRKEKIYDTLWLATNIKME